MSVRKTEGVVRHKVSKATGGSLKGIPHHVRFRLTVMTVIAIALIVILAVGTFIIVRHFSRDNDAKKAQTATAAEIANLSPTDKADYLAGSNKYADAQALLDTQITQTKDPSVKSNLYIQKATLAMNAKKYTEAMKYAKSADLVLPTSGSAELIAQIAIKTGDTVLAKQYLNTAISRVTPTTVNGNLKVRQYQTELQGVGN